MYIYRYMGEKRRGERMRVKSWKKEVGGGEAFGTGKKSQTICKADTRECRVYKSNFISYKSQTRLYRLSEQIFFCSSLSAKAFSKISRGRLFFFFFFLKEHVRRNMFTREFGFKRIRRCFSLCFEDEAFCFGEGLGFGHIGHLFIV